MKYIVAGNYTRFAVTLTQKSGELITPYIPTEGDVVQISLYGARRFDYPNYEQAQNVLTFEDNGCLNVGLYCLEVKITEANTHKLRCMYREQIRVVASNDDVPTDASFTDDDVQLSGQFDIAASVEITIDDALSETSENPVQNKVITLALNTKGDKLEIASVQMGVQLSLKRGDVVLSNAILHFAGLSLGKGGLMSAYDYSKLAALPTAGALDTTLAGKQDVLTFDNAPTQNSDNPVKSGGVYTALRDKLGKIDDGVYVSTQSGGRIDFYASGTQYVLLLAPIPNATTTDNGLMSAGDHSKLAALPTNADLAMALAGKQDTLTFDSVPTQNSDNPVTSGGLYVVLGDIESVLDNINGD